ncbi:MAG: hypothetical protein PW999_09800 [Paraburkholderia tropica]|nr:hypothetical protein [Paraburkholderia tropica]
MFYSDIRREPLRVRVSNYILRFDAHYDEYANGTLVRTVCYSQITLQ